MPKAILNPLEAILKTHSRVLAEEVRQHPHWLDDLQIEREFLKEDFHSLLESLPFQNLALASFRRRCLTRILLRDVLGHATLAQTTAEISTLADAILDWSYRQIRAEAESAYGAPQLEDGSVCGCAIVDRWNYRPTRNKENNIYWY